MKKITAIIAVITTITTVLAFGVTVTFAQGTGLTATEPPIIPYGTNNQKTTPSTPGTPDIATLKLPGAGGGNNPEDLQQIVLPNITNIVIGLTGGLSLLFVIISGIQILTAYGNEEKLGAAKKTIMWALVGLIISLLSYAIVQILVSISF